MRLDTIHHIAVLCSDYRAAKAFYAEKLGFPVIRIGARTLIPRRPFIQFILGKEESTCAS